jgi:hypothetical protein
MSYHLDLIIDPTGDYFFWALLRSNFESDSLIVFDEPGCLANLCVLRGPKPID